MSVASHVVCSCHLSLFLLFVPVCVITAGVC